MTARSQEGFSLLEALLAIVVVAAAGLGVYSLYNSGLHNYSVTDASSELVEMANVFTDLSSSQLTSGLTSANIVSTFYNSGRMSSNYFQVDSDGTVSAMVNKFGALAFGTATPYSYSVDVPLGCSDKGTGVAEGFYSSVRNQYYCDATGSTDFSACTVKLGSDKDCNTVITLFFDLTM